METTIYYNRVYVGVIVPLTKIEDGMYGDLFIIYPKPCSCYFRRTISPKPVEEAFHDDSESSEATSFSVQR